MYNGWTQELPTDAKQANELAAVLAILASAPNNAFWRARLFALTGPRKAAYLMAYELQRGPARAKVTA